MPSLGQLTGPWIVGGDCSISPEDLIATRWYDVVGGVVFTPTTRTCTTAMSESRYDSFVVRRAIAHAVVAVQRIEDGGSDPLELGCRGMQERCESESLPGLRFPGIIPNRPQQAAPDYSEIIQLAERRSSPHTSEATGKWIALSKQVRRPDWPG